MTELHLFEDETAAKSILRNIMFLQIPKKNLLKYCMSSSIRLLTIITGGGGG